jgi:hypothetical protein
MQLEHEANNSCHLLVPSLYPIPSIYLHGMVLRQKYNYTFTVHYCKRQEVDYVGVDTKILPNFVVGTYPSVIKGDAEKNGFHSTLN